MATQRRPVAMATGGTHLGAAELDDPLHLLVDELHAPQRRVAQPTDLALHQQLERDLRTQSESLRPDSH